MKPEEQRKLAIKCNADEEREFPSKLIFYTFGVSNLAAYTAQVEAPLQARIAQLEQDAKRYRYLRSQVNNDEGTPMAQVVWKLHWVRESSNWTNLVDGNNLDEHCDKALELK